VPSPFRVTRIPMKWSHSGTDPLTSCLPRCSGCLGPTRQNIQSPWDTHRENMAGFAKEYYMKKNSKYQSPFVEVVICVSKLQNYSREGKRSYKPQEIELLHPFLRRISFGESLTSAFLQVNRSYSIK